MYKRFVAVLFLLCFLPMFSLLYVKKKEQQKTIKATPQNKLCTFCVWTGCNLGIIGQNFNQVRDFVSQKFSCFQAFLKKSSK